MATAEERKEFDRKAGGKMTHPIPKPPEFPKEIFDKPVPERKADVERFNKELDDWRKKIAIPELEAVVAAATGATTPAGTSTAGPKGPKGTDGKVGPIGPPGPAGPAGAAGATTLTLLATEDIAAYKVVTSTGKNADSSNLAHIGRVVGISKAQFLNGFTGPVAQSGELTNVGWTWSGPGVLLYLNGTAISETAPSTGFVQKVGVAVNGNKMIVELGDAIML